MNFDWIDISRGFQPDGSVWGEGTDTSGRNGGPFGQGRSSGIACMAVGSYTGTHVGAPCPLQKHGMGIDRMSFSPTVGLAKVIEIHDKHVVKVEELQHHRIFPHERILLKTRPTAATGSDGAPPPPGDHDLTLEPAAARWLVERRISTLGVDTLSISGSRQHDDVSRRVLSEAGIWIIEGLDLSMVHSGEYMLICLPLKIVNGDEAPARAILQRVR